MEIGSGAAVANWQAGGQRARYPNRADSRTREGALFPEIKPRFTFPPGCRVFTIGSCFARNIEKYLTDYDLPTMRFSAPKVEWPDAGPNGLLNEYNAGAIAQRIERAFTGQPAPAESIVPHPDGGFIDLLLPGNTAVSRERAFERRIEIDAIYRGLLEADVVIITLGLIEVWFDTDTGIYLNRIPPAHSVRDEPGRYKLRVMDVSDVYPLLEAATRRLIDAGSKVLMTVSPVPFNTTFSGEDAIVANSLSKAVLRVCAHRLAMNPAVDYFPSFEIVVSGGLNSFIDDNIHVQDHLVGQVVQHMLKAYAPEPLVPADVLRPLREG